MARRFAYRLGTPGEHVVLNSLALLAVCEALGAEVVQAAAALGDLRAAAGRGERRPIAVDGGQAVLLDESYNANPASMRAALAVLGQLPGRGGSPSLATCWSWATPRPSCTRLWPKRSSAAAVDLVFTCGPGMAHLHDALPARVRGGHAADSAALAPMVAAGVAAGRRRAGEGLAWAAQWPAWSRP